MSIVGSPRTHTTTLKPQLSDDGAVRELFNQHHVAATPASAITQFLTAGGNVPYYDFPHDVYQVTRHAAMVFWLLLLANVLLLANLLFVFSSCTYSHPLWTVSTMEPCH